MKIVSSWTNGQSTIGWVYGTVYGNYVQCVNCNKWFREEKMDDHYSYMLYDTFKMRTNCYGVWNNG